jgi:glutamate-1-semialdehyde 2,1-aminomutase
LKRDKSNQLFEEAKEMFPGGVHSPVRAFKSVEGSPLFIESSEGCYITDVDGNRFLDFCCSWGPLILGHNNAAVREAIQKTVAKGTSFGTPTAQGNEIGRLILDNHRYLEQIRFVSSGTEAVMSAIRLARGYTGKNKIIKFEGCYHGHVDSLLVKAGSGLVTLGTSSSAGIPESFAKETIVLPLNDLEALTHLMETNDDIAAIIIEPVPANNGLLIQDRNFLVWLRTLCDKHNVLLIFDEVISGFRVGFEGASAYYTIQADLLTFGKIIGGGMPVGAFGGSKEIMKHVAPLGNVYQAGTLSANPVTLAAGIAAIRQLLEPGFYEALEAKTQYFVDKIQAHCDRQDYAIRMQNIASIFWFGFSRKRAITSEDIDPAAAAIFKKMHSKLLEKGIYLGPSCYEVGFISAAHTYKDLDTAISAICSTLDEIY